MNSGKTTIHEYDSVIYPLHLWVAINPTFKELSNKFLAITENGEVLEFIEDNIPDSTQTIATTFKVVNKKSGIGGPFVLIFQPKRINVKYIAHEATHATDFFAEALGISSGSFEHGEAYAYLVGWVADCIERTTKKKKK